jgi:hypothetical protein
MIGSGDVLEFCARTGGTPTIQPATLNKLRRNPDSQKIIVLKFNGYQPL